MRILLDENLPKKLKREFPQHEIWTAREKGWNGKKNGELLALMLQDGIDVLLTFDKNLQHQQNFSKYPIVVIVLNAFSNDYAELLVMIMQNCCHLCPKYAIFWIIHHKQEQYSFRKGSESISVRFFIHFSLFAV